MTVPVSLVTGGAGFIGSHVADELLKLGFKVVVLDDLSGGFRDNVPDGAEFFAGSILDEAVIARLFTQYRFDYVYHLAAYAAEGLSHFIKRFNFMNNVVGSVNLINAAVNFDVRCFVFTSSIAVYGSAQVPMVEDTTPIPEDSYGIAKFAVELELAATKRLFGLNYVVFRPHNVYGERQNTADKYRNVIGIFMNKLMKDEPMPIFGDGRQQRAFTYISDVAPVIAGAVANPQLYNQTFNIGADTPCRICDLAETVAEAMGKPCHTLLLPAREEAYLAFSSHAKLSRLTGYMPRVNLEEGVRRMASWAKKVGPRASRPFDEIEIKKNLPAAWS
ncbi:MAG: NAD-dependent epimerase/dehydratase family protein [Thermoanaerobaculales bacterium]